MFNPAATSCPDRSQLEAFARGQLPVEAAQVLVDHLSTCPSCETSLLELVRAVDPVETRTYPPTGPDLATVAFPPDSSPEPGQTPIPFGRFLLLSRLAPGGMGIVYRAYDTKLRRVVALKRLTTTGVNRADAHRRFAREAEAIARLDHPNIVKVYEVGVVRDEPFFVMDFVQGGTLVRGDRPESLTEKDIARILETVARAVQFAHEAQILHRDLKPANILMTPEGSPKVADFGLVKFLDESEWDRLTQTGEFLGTPQYMAPEQVRGNPAELSVRTDVYGLGAILYDLLANQPPFAGSLAQDVRERVLNQYPIPPSRFRPGLNPYLEAICLKCLEKDPDRRYATAQELAADLALWQAQGYARARPATRIQKAWHSVRRHPIRTLAVVAVLALAVVIPFALRAANPDRAAQSAMQSIADGHETVLVDEFGQPQVRPRLLVGSAVLIVPATTAAPARPLAPARPSRAGEPLVLEGTTDHTFVELLPRVPTEAYRLSAQLCQMSPHTPLGSKFRERVGLYFASNPVPDADPTTRSLFNIWFSEYRPGSAKEGPAVAGPAKAELRFEVTTDVELSSGSVAFNEVTAPPLDKVWRKLEVLVSSDGIEWWWNGIPARALNSVDRRAGIDKIRSEGRDGPGLPSDHRGGCGLFVKGTTLHVKSVVITPIHRVTTP